jgi:hypothetical protein
MILPGWKLRAEKLEAHGIVDAVQFLEADNGWLRDISGARREETIIGWKQRLEQQLVAKPRRG